jgi:hypothetical protein
MFDYKLVIYSGVWSNGQNGQQEGMWESNLSCDPAKLTVKKTSTGRYLSRSVRNSVSRIVTLDLRVFCEKNDGTSLCYGNALVLLVRQNGGD